MKKISKKFKKTLDKQKNYDIILKCVIILFFYGGILPFFQERIVNFAKNFHRNTAK